MPFIRSLCRCFLALSLTVIAAMPAATADESADREAELERVRQRIEALRKEISTDVSRRDSETRRLKEVELEIARLAKDLKKLAEERRRTERRLNELRREQKVRSAQLGEEQKSLAGHLRSAYMTGRQERVRLLLSQEDPQALGRLMVYYGYLSRLRAGRIDSITEQLEELAEVTRQVRNETERREALESEQTAQLATLEDTYRQRNDAVRNLNRRITEQGEEVTRLKQQEASLKTLINRIRSALEEFPVDAQEDFAKLKGRLTWPVAGRLIKDYGQPRAGGRLRWNGVLVAADRGTEVGALYHGRVAFADWLPGLGLLIVLEHGGGYLSLYGHNQTLLKSAGEWVTAGEVIATVGDSGGRPEPAIYFEIRRGVKPVNPHDWARTRLSGK